MKKLINIASVITLILHASCSGRIVTPVPLGTNAKIEQLMPASSSSSMYSGRILSIAANPANRSIVFAASESGGLFKSIDGGNTWKWIKEFPCFRVHDLKFHPTRPNFLFCSALNDLKATNGGGIWYSEDGGTTWNKAILEEFTPSTRFSAFEINFLGNDAYFGTSSGIFRTTSYEPRVTCRQVSRVPIEDAISVFPISASTILYKTGNYYGVVTDGVESRISMQSDLASASRSKSAYAPHPFNANTFFAVGTNGNILKYTSNDNSITLFESLPADPSRTQASRPEFIKTSITNQSLGAFDIYFSNGILLYAASFTYSDGATQRVGNWRNITMSHADPTDVLFDVSGKPIMVSGDGGIMQSDNNGVSFVKTVTPDKGLNALQVYDVGGRFTSQGGSAETDLFWGTQDDGIWAGKKNTINWRNLGMEGGCFRLIRRPTTVAEKSVPFTNISTLEVYTCNSEFNYYPLLYPTTADPQLAWLRTPLILPEGNLFSIFSASGQFRPHIFMSNTGNWVPYQIVVPQTTIPNIKMGGISDPVIFFPVTDVERSASTGALVYKLMKLTGTPQHPSVQEVPGSHSIVKGEYVYAVNPTNPNHMIVTTVQPEKTFYTLTGGYGSGDAQGWTEITSLNRAITHNGTFELNRSLYSSAHLNANFNSNILCIEFNPDNPNAVWAGTKQSGVFVSGDAGVNWVYVDGSLEIPDIRSVFIESDTTAFVSSYGRGVFKITLQSFKRQSMPIVDYGPWIRLTNGVTKRLRDLNDPEICPICQFVEVKGGYFTSVKLDKNNKILSATIDGGQLSETVTGSPNELFNSKRVEISEKMNFDDDPWLTKQLADGSVIVGLVIDGGYLKGVITSSKSLAAIDLKSKK